MGVQDLSQQANTAHFITGITETGDETGISIIMGYDNSISLEGLRAAENQLNNTARKVSKPINGSDVAASAGEVTDCLTLAGDTDIAGAMVEVQETKILYKTNLKMIAMQMELEEEMLDLFG